MKKTLHTICVFCAVLCGTYSYAEAPQSNKIEISESATSTASSDNSSAAYGVSIGTVDAQLYSESGLNLDNFDEVKYVCRISNGTYLGFEDDNYHYDYDSNIEHVNLIVIKSTDAAVTIPDSIKVGEKVYSVSGIYDTYLDNAFSQDIRILTIPNTITNISSGTIEKCNLEAIYVLGKAPKMYAEFNSVPDIYVCDKTCFASFFKVGWWSNLAIHAYGWDYVSTNVDVKKNGEFAETYLTQNNYDWGAAQYVKVTGNINDIDLDAMKNLTTLIKLDLSETSITSLPVNFMYGMNSLTEIKLPATLAEIGAYAFSGCVSLSAFDLKEVQIIGTGVFENCRSLSYIDLNKVNAICERAFYSCEKLNNIDLSKVINIGAEAFFSCSSLETADLTSAVNIGHRMGDTYFSYGSAFKDCTSLKNVILGNSLLNIFPGSFCNTAIETIALPEGLSSVYDNVFEECSNLKSIELPSSIISIGQNAFSNCSSLSNIIMKSGLRNIGQQAFHGCTSLQDITIPSTVTGIGKSAFDKTGIKNFKCYAAVPPVATSSFIGADMDLSRTYLYVPPFSKDFYRNTQYWSNFYLMRSIDDQIDYIPVDRPLTINLEEEDNAVVANNPTIDLKHVYDGYHSVGQLTAKGEGTLSAGQLIISGQLFRRNASYIPNGGGQYIPTLINYADKMRADNVTHNLTFTNGSGGWHFISLPYDVKVSDIVPSNNTFWVIRRYDSTARAAGETAATWVNLTGNDVMEAGKGYIVSATGGESYIDEYGYTQTAYPCLAFTSGNSLTKNNLFRSTDVIVPLTEYPAEFAHNRSWNFIGNPYPCYFDMHYLNEEFTAPVTIWNGSSYVAYSPVDDDLVLAPYEAFFVQCPLDATEMTFREAGRMHSDEGKTFYKSPAKSRVITSLEDRNIFNFEITGGSSSDRARIVLSPEASLNYEVGRDASKFFAGNNNNAQIYVAADVNYSISERPFADGLATLGVRFSGEDVYTLSLSGNYNHGWSVIVTDNLTGTSVDLTKEDYKFAPVDGNSNNRFSVKFEHGEISGIESVISDFGENAVVTVSAINGMTVYSGRMSEINVPTVGLYIISNGKETRKAILK